MSKRMIEITVDDLSGETLERGQGESIRFAVGNATYEMDLGKANAEAFHKALAPYVAIATKVARNASPAAASTTGTRKADLVKIRQWATENGFTVSNRGRIPDAVTAAYNAAH